MLTDAASQKDRLTKLTDKRKVLSDRFDKNPGETRLALELKIIDDQIAEWNREAQNDRKRRL